MIFIRAAKQIRSCFPKGKDISGKAGIEVHTSSLMKNDSLSVFLDSALGIEVIVFH